MEESGSGGGLRVGVQQVEGGSRAGRCWGAGGQGGQGQWGGDIGGKRSRAAGAAMARGSSRGGGGVDGATLVGVAFMDSATR